MELLYIWIEDYKIIQNQGFNFSPRWRFDYNPENRNLKIEERQEEVIPHFFGKDISNITAIVGKNGVGKSQLLHEIGMGLTGHNSNNSVFNNIIIIEKKAERKIEIITNKNLKYNSDFPKLDIVQIRKKNMNFEVYSLLYSHNFDFSSSSETQSERVSFTSISSVKLFQRFQEIIVRQFQFGGLDDVSGFTFFPDFYETLSKFETNSQMAFWIKNRDIMESYNFMPKRIKISGLMDTFPFSEKLTYQTRETGKDKFLIWFVACILRSLKNHTALDYLPEIKDIHSVDRLVEVTIASSKKLQNEKCEAVIELILKVREYIESGIFSFENAIGYAIIDIENYFNEFKTFFEIYQRTIFSTTTPTKNYEDYYLNIYWEHQFSTGEHFLQSFFSRMDYQKKEINEKNIVLLLDEVETGFHPEWQKKYVKILTEFLPLIFCRDENGNPNGKKLQIFITSHSPFVLSDLPKNNVLLLNKNEDKKCIVLSTTANKNNTFGANIHTLLSNDFFLDGLIGEFAQEKINDVIKFLDNIPQDKINSVEQAEKIIDLIGEPILKRHLTQKLDSKRLRKVDDIENDIKRLQRELNRVKSNRKKYGKN